MVSNVADDGSLLHRSVNACLCPLYAVEGMHVVTVEGEGRGHQGCNAPLTPHGMPDGATSSSSLPGRAGIGNGRAGLHPVQERLARAHGSQCGFCTPGFVMSMYSLLRSKTEAPTEEEIEENLAGNLW